MAVLDRLKFDAPSNDWFVSKFESERGDDQIRIGSQLVVNQSQEAVFFKGGKALDVFGPGTHTLSTANIPLLSSLMNLPFGGQTPFTAELWFVNCHAKRALTWGTKTPIPLLDPRYNYPVSVRAFGNWGIRIIDSRSILTHLVGTLSSFKSDDILEAFTGEIVQRLSDALAKYFVAKDVSILQVNAFLNDLSQFVGDDIRPELSRFGLEVVNFNVHRVSIPEEEQRTLQEVLKKRMEIDQLSQTAPGAGYTTSRTFDTLEKMAENESGIAGNLMAGGFGAGIGLAAGVAAGQQVGNSLTPDAQPKSNLTERLSSLKELLDAGLITEDDFSARKAQILDEI